ncbi:hypothetical protein WICPIJ_004861 [Wickerhamomyces pijperi]|uniref:Uncharacterized protein n=1 Tax=Wickerhamomyces pijperi TaxID=599730 RepID=A0A9P8Q4M0_WICPI|nr:hypothetical protein WICPIJ_004861 [Wickerhamomyces pijperi]
MTKTLDVDHEEDSLCTNSTNNNTTMYPPNQDAPITGEPTGEANQVPYCTTTSLTVKKKTTTSKPRKKRTKKPDASKKSTGEPPLKKPQKVQKPTRKKVEITDLPHELIREIYEHCSDLDYMTFKVLRDCPSFGFLNRYYLPVTNVRKEENLTCFRSIYHKSSKDYMQRQYFSTSTGLQSLLKRHLEKYKVKASEVTIFLEFEENIPDRERYERLFNARMYSELSQSAGYEPSPISTKEILHTSSNGFKRTWIYFRNNYTVGTFNSCLNNNCVIILNYEALKASTFKFLLGSRGPNPPRELRILNAPKHISSDPRCGMMFNALESKFTSYYFKAGLLDVESISFKYCLKCKENIQLDMIPNVKRIVLERSPYFLNHLNSFQNHQLMSLETLIIDGTPMSDFTRCSFPELKTLRLLHKSLIESSKEGINITDNYLPKLETLEIRLHSLECFFGNTFGPDHTLKDVSLCIDSTFLTGRSSIPDILQQATRVRIIKDDSTPITSSDANFKYFIKVFKSFDVKSNRIESLILMGFDLDFIHTLLKLQKTVNLKSLKIMKCTSIKHEPLTIPPFYKSLESLWLIHTDIQRLSKIPLPLKHFVYTLPTDLSMKNTFHHVNTGNSSWVSHYAMHDDVFTAPPEERSTRFGFGSATPSLYFIDHEYIHQNHGKAIELKYHARLNFDLYDYTTNFEKLMKSIEEKEAQDSLNGSKGATHMKTLKDLLRPVSSAQDGDQSDNRFTESSASMVRGTLSVGGSTNEEIDIESEYE